jgi:hypothetical protein
MSASYCAAQEQDRATRVVSVVRKNGDVQQCRFLRKADVQPLQQAIQTALKEDNPAALENAISGLYLLAARNEVRRVFIPKGFVLKCQVDKVVALWNCFRGMQAYKVNLTITT